MCIRNYALCIIFTIFATKYHLLQKIMQMRKRILWMLAAILTICGTTAFTSCSEEDDNSVSPKMAQLPGTWYTEYDQPGMIEVGDSVITYSKVVQACIFNDGKGPLV